MLYDGEHFVSEKGKHSWTIDAEAISALNEAIWKRGYYTMIEQAEAEEVTCLPTCVTSVLLEDGKYREINHDYGCNKFPKKLDAFENKIERIVGAKEYIGKVQFSE